MFFSRSHQSLRSQTCLASPFAAPLPLVAMAMVSLNSGAPGCFASASEQGLKVIRLVTALVTHRPFVPKWERGGHDSQFSLMRGQRAKQQQTGLTKHQAAPSNSAASFSVFHVLFFGVFFVPKVRAKARR